MGKEQAVTSKARVPRKRCVQHDLDTLITARYVEVDDLFIGLGIRQGSDRPPRLTDAELVRLALAQVLLGCHSERRWLRFAEHRLGHLFPDLPQQPADNRRLRRRRQALGPRHPPPGRPHPLLVGSAPPARLHPGALRYLP